MTRPPTPGGVRRPGESGGAGSSPRSGGSYVTPSAVGALLMAGRQKYLLEISEDVGYAGRFIAEPTDGMQPEQFCNDQGENMRLWLMQDYQSYNWQTTNAATEWLQGIPQIM